MRYRNIIFDIDETIIETRRAKGVLIEYIVSRYLPEFDHREFNEILMDEIRTERVRHQGKSFVDFGAGLDDILFHKKIGKYMNVNGRDLKHRMFKNAIERMGGIYKYSVVGNIIDDLENSWVKGYTVYPGMFEIFKELKARGCRLFGLSNGFAEIQKMKIEQCRIGYWFEKIYISEEINMGKPDEKVFELVVRENNLRKDETVMVGDSYEKDILPANRICIDTLHIGTNQIATVEELKGKLLGDR